jgi:hypothetical protein
MNNGKISLYLVLLFVLIFGEACNKTVEDGKENTTIQASTECMPKIEYLSYKQMTTDSLRIQVDNELRLSIDVLKRKMVGVGVDDSLQAEILKLFSKKTENSVDYDKKFFQDYTVLANDICATFNFLQNQNLKQETRDALEKQLVSKMRDFSVLMRGGLVRDTLEVVKVLRDTIKLRDTVELVKTFRDTIFINPEPKVVNPKFIGTFYFAGVYASSSLEDAKKHLGIIRRKGHNNSNVAWNRSNSMYQVYVGPYKQKQNAINAKVKVKSISTYKDAYVFKAKRYEQGIIEWAK